MTRLWIAIGVCFAASVVADIVVGASPPGFYALFGLIGCALIIVVSKWLGKTVIQRPEAYYGEPPGRDSDDGPGQEREHAR